jgi:NAD(P)-dependent dehydrogenase (short-subunit alcohol dehydrogenase family)
MGLVVITGAASGLGLALRQRVEKRGDRVLGVDLAGSDVDADLSTAEGREVALAAVRAAATDGGLQGAALCAGIGPPRDPVLMTSVNYFGVVVLLDALTPLLAETPGSAVVLISSNSVTLVPEAKALVAACLDGDEDVARAAAVGLDPSVTYANTKLAVARAMRRRAGALGTAGVRVNAVAPGPFDSGVLQTTLADPTLAPLVDALPSPLGRRGTAEEVAAAVDFLLSPEASNVHGSLLFVDGGIDASVSPERVP